MGINPRGAVYIVQTQRMQYDPKEITQEEWLTYRLSGEYVYLDIRHNEHVFRIEGNLSYTPGQIGIAWVGVDNAFHYIHNAEVNASDAGLRINTRLNDAVYQRARELGFDV